MTHSADGELTTGLQSVEDVSFQVYQDVYNTLTGRSERINRLLYNAHRTRLSDFEQLHACIEQTVEQYDCRSSNLSITVRFTNGKSERFSGFEKFSQQATNRSYAVESVELEYNFLFILPKTQEPKPYTVEVGLRSTLGMLEYLRSKEASTTEVDMMYDFRQPTGRLEIEYVDLAVGRSLEAQVDEWYSSLERLPTKLGKFSQALSGAGAISLRIAAILAASLLLLNNFGGVETWAGAVNAVVVTVAAFTVIGYLTFPLSNIVSRLLKRTGSQSLIVLSKADEALETRFLASPWKALGKSLLSILGAIIIGLVTSYFASLLGV